MSNLTNTPATPSHPVPAQSGSTTTTQPGAATHWSISAPIDPSKLTHLYHLPHKLSASNYITWITTMESSLMTVDLFSYCKTGGIPTPQMKDEMQNWQHADVMVQSVLMANMTKEVVCQVGHLQTAEEIWKEARHLFSSQMLTNWTLTISSMVTTKFIDGEDVSAHIAKMKSYRRDLIMMNRNIDDDLFACFVHISMPTSWNYVFTGLPDKYTSLEVEQRIKDEYGVQNNQLSMAAAYSAIQNQKGHQRSNQKLRLGEPFCENC